MPRPDEERVMREMRHKQQGINANLKKQTSNLL
jgi:hypothetical protein